jgi:hypothetical protein
MTTVREQLEAKIAPLIDPMAFSEPTPNDNVLYRLDSFEEGRQKAAVKAKTIVAALPWQILDALEFIDGYEWSSDDLRDFVLDDAIKVFNQKVYENWVADQRRIREDEAKKLKGEEAMAREIEKVARLLCMQSGHNPDGGKICGFGWINYKPDAIQILKSLGMIDEAD